MRKYTARGAVWWFIKDIARGIREHFIGGGPCPKTFYHAGHIHHCQREWAHREQLCTAYCGETDAMEEGAGYQS